MLPLFIGDEATAAAYRLAGLDVEVAQPREAPARFAAALRRHPPFIMITADCASAVPADDFDAALAGFDPPVVIVPDVRGRVAMPDLSTRVRAELGIAA